METQIYGRSLRFMITAVQWTKESSFRLCKTELDGSVKQEHPMSWFHTKCTFFLIFKKDFLLFYVCVLSAYVSVHPRVCLMPSETRGGVRSPGAGVLDSRELGPEP